MLELLVDRLVWSVALRALLGSRRLTVLTTIVVSVSIMLVIFLSALIEGLRVDLIKQTTGAIAHIELRPQARKPPRASSFSDDRRLYLGQRSTRQRQQLRMENWRRWQRYAEGFSEDIVAVSPSVQGQGFLQRGAEERNVRIQAVWPRRFDAITAIEANLRKGRFLQMRSGEIAVGQPLADELGLQVGDRLRLVTARGESVDKRLAGIYQTGFGVIDNGTVLMLLSDGQSLFGLGAAITQIGITVRDVFAADAVALRMREQVPHEVRHWKQDNQRLLSALEGQSRSSDMITFFTAVAALFAIASILIVLVSNKLSEIGILKAMGASRAQVRMIFALQGTLLAFFGGCLGALLGSALVLGLKQIRVTNERTGQLEQLFPFALSLELVLASIALATILGLVASILPARRAGSVDPIEVIRG